MQLINAVKKNNRGFSLVEIVVAIALFAVVITPVMNSFITSARVNQRARKVMIATDVCQDIIEGYSEMTYETIAGGLTSFGTVDLGGPIRYSSINGDKFNVSANFLELDNATASVFPTYFGTVTPTALTINGTAVSTYDLVSPAYDNVTNQMAGVYAARARDAISNNAIAADKSLFGTIIKATETDPTTGATSPSEKNGLIMMYYRDIEADTGNHFDAVVIIMPVARTGVNIGGTDIVDTYYCNYCIKVWLFDTDEDIVYNASDGVINSLVTMTSGVVSE